MYYNNNSVKNELENKQLYLTPFLTTFSNKNILENTSRGNHLQNRKKNTVHKVKGKIVEDKPNKTVVLSDFSCIQRRGQQ